MDAQSSDDLVLFGELTDTCSAPRFIGDRQSSCQFDSIQEDPDDSISALLGTPMLVNSEICMTELNDLVSWIEETAGDWVSLCQLENRGLSL